MSLLVGGPARLGVLAQDISDQSDVERRPGPLASRRRAVPQPGRPGTQLGDGSRVPRRAARVPAAEQFRVVVVLEAEKVQVMSGRRGRSLIEHTGTSSRSDPEVLVYRYLSG